MGWEPIHAAAAANAADSLDVLLSWGADPNTHQTSGHTPLHLSVQRGYYDVS